MASREKKMWDEVATVLEHRHGWSFEAQSTPGADPCWCYSSVGRNQISVSVDSGSIGIYLIEIDQEISVDSPQALVSWIEENPLLFS